MRAALKQGGLIDGQMLDPKTQPCQLFDPPAHAT